MLDLLPAYMILGRLCNKPHPLQDISDVIYPPLLHPQLQCNFVQVQVTVGGRFKQVTEATSEAAK